MPPPKRPTILAGTSDPLKGSPPSLLLGVTGSIAAYKSLDLIRRLTDEGISTRVVATRNARPFFPFLSAEIFSNSKVETELFSGGEGKGRIRHLDLLDGADLLLVAPATANFIARISLGMADDLLSAIALSARIPILLAPAMEEAMYLHPASTEHRKRLQDRGVREILPQEGPLASGRSGMGRMAPVDRILEAVREVLARAGSPGGPLSGRNVLVSSGPTYEPLDPVRFIGNRSSGLMGMAIVKAACTLGARVTLVSGPTALTPPPGVEFHRVETAREMGQALDRLFPETDILVMAAAVSDYRPIAPLSEKKKKDGREWTLTLSENSDILKGLSARRRPDQRLVGFAAESALEVEPLLKKCRAKGVDLLVANDISKPGIGFGSTDNEALFVFSDGRSLPVPRTSKETLAFRIFENLP
jgi:phosphopantothenoylcysteine decarboxylase/phosphopantothenate--cysteine ligase